MHTLTAHRNTVACAHLINEAASTVGTDVVHQNVNQTVGGSTQRLLVQNAAQDNTLFIRIPTTAHTITAYHTE